jgi:polyhydroxyalkanoate synthesis repressor PhaR
MTPPKTVKRYANRKLYDTERSCYVTLEDISTMIKAGDEVRVVDNKSGEDLTSVTLAQIIFETEKKKNFMPLSLLRRLIREGGGAIDDARERMVGSVHAKAEEIKTTANKLRTDFSDRIGGVISRRAGDGDGLSSSSSDPRKYFADLFAASQRTFDDLQRSIEERLRSVGALARYPSLGREMEELRQRLVELEERLEKIPE